MEKSKYIDVAKGVYCNLCRLLLAVVFLFSGVTKAIDPHGTEYKIGDYLTAFGIGGLLPESLPLTLAMALAVVEFMVGLFLAFGINRRFATVLCLVIMLFMTPLTLYIAVVNPVSDCGCFGEVLVISNWQTFAKNVILLVAVLSLFLMPHYKVPTLIGENTKWLVAMYGFLFVIVLEAYCIHYLPIADFSAYKAGTNIKEGMTVPEGAEMPEYESIFVMEKDGVKKEFTLEEYPDSTWAYVDTKTTLIKEGYVPPIHDFMLQSPETGEDVTDELLEREGNTFLLSVYDLTKAGQGVIDQINDLYDYCLKNGYAFQALTASSEEQIERWKYETGAVYPFLSADGTMLKTLVRSNPGLVLLHDGTIIHKWGQNELPLESELDEGLSALDQLDLTKSPMSKLLSVVLIFLLIPLAAIMLLDRVWAGIRLIGKIRKKSKIANLLKKSKNEKENCCRKLEDE